MPLRPERIFIAVMIVALALVGLSGTAQVDVTDTSASPSPSPTTDVISLRDFVGWAIQFTGWFVGASAAYWLGLRAESKRREHARQGTYRQIRTLLRRAVETIEPFVYASTYGYKLNLNEVEQTYQRFTERLNERETAVALSDAEYNLLDTFVDHCGRTLACTRRLVDVNVSTREAYQEKDRIGFAQDFIDTLWFLGRALDLTYDG